MIPVTIPRSRTWLLALLSLGAVVLLAFVLPANLFLSAPDTDLIGEMAPWRAFAADTMRAGHWPLWNPYTYAGQPFLGDFQSGLLYPLNAIFLFLPLARAVNLSFLLHLWILGWGVGVWSRRRGHHWKAATLAGWAAALSGPVFMRLYAGHLPNICTMAWAPWMFCALETAWRRPTWRAAARPMLLAAGAVGLQILGGHPQYVFYIAITAGLHAVMQSLLNPVVRRRALPMTVVVYGAGAALAAAQLLPGLAATADSVRAGRLDYDFVRVFSFPPENFLTLLVPGFFGNLSSAVYWGHCYLWEVCPFIGVTGVVMASLAAGDAVHRRRALADLALAGMLLVLALGDNTPLLRILYDNAPGFGQFRCLAKFTFPAMLFMVLGLGAGADALIAGRVGKKILAMVWGVLGVVALAAGVFIGMRPTSLARMIQWAHNSGDVLLPTARLTHSQFIPDAGAQAGQALMGCGLVLVATGAALLLARRWPRWRWLVQALLPLEMLAFAHSNIGTSHVADLEQPAIRAYLMQHPGDYRVLNLVRSNNGYLLGASDLWGDRPLVLKRYAEFMNYTQGEDPDHPSQYLAFKVMAQAFNVVRFGAAFVPDENSADGFRMVTNPAPLPRALLVANYQVLAGRDAILAALNKPDFNPRQTVILEEEPTPGPQAGAGTGSAKVTDFTTDSITIEAETPVPALLLITDLYNRDWRVRPLEGSSQANYEILPADYIVRAIPLGAGHHHLVVEYAPPSFRQGLFISLLAGVIWLGLFAWTMVRGRRGGIPRPTPDAG